MPDLFVADTNVYIGAANDPADRERFEAFILEHGPLLVSAVVAAEVLLGVADVSRHAAVTDALGAGVPPLAPSAEDWTAAAMTVTRLGGDAVTKSRCFWNDALLAAQCARLGATLITRNLPDFRRLGRALALRVAAPFPR